MLSIASTLAGCARSLSAGGYLPHSLIDTFAGAVHLVHEQPTPKDAVILDAEDRHPPHLQPCPVDAGSMPVPLQPDGVLPLVVECVRPKEERRRSAAGPGVGGVPVQRRERLLGGSQSACVADEGSACGLGRYRLLRGIRAGARVWAPVAGAPVAPSQKKSLSGDFA
jgi:hypothetical protein